MFDFVSAYSIRREVVPRAALFQIRLNRMVQRLSGEFLIAKAATAAWLSTHNTKVRCSLDGSCQRCALGELRRTSR